MDPPAPRRASPADAATVAEMLHAFNTEFDTPTPTVDVLTERLRRLLAGEDMVALLAGDPPTAVPAALPATRSSIALVGHEPGMSELAWLLLSGEPRERVIRFKKGATAKLGTDDPPSPGGAFLRWLLTPEAFRKS